MNIAGIGSAKRIVQKDGNPRRWKTSCAWSTST
jgi:hypothetical protein